jgi:hypothetical protein
MIRTWVTLSILSLLFSLDQSEAKASGPVEIGVSRIDITPDHPVRLTGYGNRTNVFDSVEQKLWAKALVLAQKGKPTMVWITLDLIGFPGFFADALYYETNSKNWLKGSRAISSILLRIPTTGPRTGVLVNIFGKTLPPEQLA